MSLSPTACLIIIGNEILSGRTQDKNLAWLALKLNDAGVKLAEARVIPDIEATIIETVNACRAKFGCVFTTGGIGPTHDDITSLSMAKAFGVKLVRHPEAERRLREHYRDGNLNDARLKMADVPEGAALIDNPVSAAPGFRIDNVYVFAGVPVIMQAMFESIKGGLNGGQPALSRTLAVGMTEGDIAQGISQIQDRYAQVEIGSYPHIERGKLSTCLVFRAQDSAMLAAAFDEASACIHTLGGTAREIL